MYTDGGLRAHTKSRMNRRHFLMSSIAATAASAVRRRFEPAPFEEPLAAAGDTRVAVLLVDTDRVIAPIDQRIYGHFLEHINHSVVDGLFAEQIRGCGFEGKDFETYWESFSDRGSVEIADVEFQNGKKSVRLHVEGGRAGIRQGRIYVDAGQEYDGSLWVRREAGLPQLTLRVVRLQGRTDRVCAARGRRARTGRRSATPSPAPCGTRRPRLRSRRRALERCWSTSFR